MALEKITEQQMDEKGVCAAPDILNGTPAQNKAIFDRMVRQLIAPAYNACVDLVNMLETSEEIRSEAETLRKTAEDLRQSAETARENAESGRVTAEQARAEAEGLRKTAETLRVEAESLRAKAEGARAESEQLRVSAENLREEAENARIEAEQGRAEAERLRTEAEQARENAETGYVAQAEHSASEALISEHNAEVWAEGGQLEGHNGDVVLQGMEVGAKGYAQQAQASAEAADAAKTEAETAESGAAGSAESAGKSEKAIRELAYGEQSESYRVSIQAKGGYGGPWDGNIAANWPNLYDEIGYPYLLKVNDDSVIVFVKESKTDGVNTTGKIAGLGVEIEKGTWMYGVLNRNDYKVSVEFKKVSGVYYCAAEAVTKASEAATSASSAESSKTAAETAASSAETLKKAAEKFASDAKTDADRAEAATVNTPKVQNGNWWVFNKSTGAYVDSGVSAYYKPVRGTDYWTAEDQAAIVSDVLAALPVGTEVSY